MAQTSVFITGGAGFIGRWVVARCLAEEWKVTAFDNLCAGRRENLADFQDRICLVQGDTTDPIKLRDAMAEASPQIVFHLAAHHFIPFCNDHPHETLRVNAEGTYTVLQAAADSGVETVVAASSGVLYPPRDEPLSEDEPPVIADVYGLSKSFTEQILELFAGNTRLRCVAARLFNTYGPYETNPHVIPHIIASLKRGPSVPLGNVLPKRDYIYVEDVADLLSRCSGIHEKYTVVNIGTGREYSVQEIVETISELIGRPIDIDVDPARVRPSDKMHQIADLKTLRRLTGTEPVYTLRQGLEKLLKHEGLL